MSLDLTQLPTLPEGWKYHPLSDLTEDRGVSYGVVQPGQHDVNGIPIVRVNNLKNNQMEIKDVMKISPEIEAKYNRSRLKGGEILLSLVGTLGQVAIVPNELAGWNTARAVGVIPVKKEYNNNWVSLCLRSKYAQHLMQMWANTTVQATLNLKDVAQLPIPMPPKGQVELISAQAILFDDKILLNNQINETLESMVKAIFKEWFIDFGPVKSKAEGKKPFGMDDKTASLFPDNFQDSELGPVPKGWKVSSIDDVCIFQNGYAFKSNLMTTNPKDAKRIFKMGNIVKGGGFNADGSDDYYPNSETHELDRYLAKKGDLLMCMTDMKNNVALLGNTALMPVSDKYLVNQRVGLLRTKNSKTVNYPFLFLLTNESVFLEELRSRANSGVQVNLSTEEIKRSKFVVPSEVVHQAFDEMALPVFEQIESNRKENEYLKNTRDLFLPRLISGEIELRGILNV